LLNLSYSLNNCYHLEIGSQIQSFFSRTSNCNYRSLACRNPFLSSNHIIIQIGIYSVLAMSSLILNWLESILLFLNLLFLVEAVFTNLPWGVLDLNPRLCNRREILPHDISLLSFYTSFVIYLKSPSCICYLLIIPVLFVTL
jgi:hypothetical protein